MLRFLTACLIALLGLLPTMPIVCDAVCRQPAQEAAREHCTQHPPSEAASLTPTIADCQQLHGIVPATQTPVRQAIAMLPEAARPFVIARVPAITTTAATYAAASPPLRPLVLRI